MDRLTESTRRAYLGQLKWWQLFCRRKGRDWLLSGADSKGEEELLVQYLLHSSVHSKKAPGTLKLRLAAIRSSHVFLGLADPFENKPRLTLIMMGLKKRYGTPVRRVPVTPGMLRWIYPELQKTMPHEYKLVWFSVSLGYYFLLRASEFLPVEHVPSSRHLQGRDVRLKRGGSLCLISEIKDAEEVEVFIRGSKTDVYNKGTTRNHFRSGDMVLCPVLATVAMFQRYPARYTGGLEEELPVCRLDNGEALTRASVQDILVRAAKAQGIEGRLGAHSLRFGGASAIWAAYRNGDVLRRYGRWASDAFHSYIWEARMSSMELAKSMTEVEMMPQ